MLGGGCLRLRCGFSALRRESLQTAMSHTGELLLWCAVFAVPFPLLPCVRCVAVQSRALRRAGKRCAHDSPLSRGHRCVVAILARGAGRRAPRRRRRPPTAHSASSGGRGGSATAPRGPEYTSASSGEFGSTLLPTSRRGTAPAAHGRLSGAIWLPAAILVLTPKQSSASRSAMRRGGQRTCEQRCNTILRRRAQRCTRLTL